MGFEFASLSYDVIVGRIMKTHTDPDCFKAMANQYFDAANARLRLKEFERLKGSEKPEQLKRLAQECADKLPRFKRFKWEEVVLDTISSLKMPRKTFNAIFGHDDDEEALYPTILKHLKSEFGSYDVYNTSRLRSKFVRFADFTAVKSGILGKKVFSFDAKTKPAAFDHFFNQVDDFQRFSDQVFLITTPGLVLEAGKKYDNTAGAESQVIEKLKRSNTGLFVLDKTSGQFALELEAQDTGSDKHSKAKAIEELKLL
ncbi:MAG: hypothetical protein JRM99_03750 [Nitrososphaerota archaeon]|nr:hypothetical protein [Nitrososphaerota archaeon]